MFVSVLRLATSFPVLSPMSSMWLSWVSSVISTTYLLIPFTIVNQEQVPSPKKNIDHDLDSLTAFMTDCHLQRGTDLRAPTDPPSYFWTLRCLEVKFSLDMSSSNLSSAASSRVVQYCHLGHSFRDTYIGAQFDQLKMIWKILRIFVRNRAANFLALCHWSEAFVCCRQFCWHHHGL